MKVKPIVPRKQARVDVDEAIAYYLEAGPASVALGFIDALEQAYSHIAHHPGTGSPRHEHELGLPGLRWWALSRYPYLVFYIEQPGHIDVWRVLHGQRDVPLWMHKTDVPE
ncbi:MAG: type II toxin-antitoxin system RelE/ParE family toxin [Rhodocyclaceae bacterium]|nr:type II toxin-antitoxin system RelE/ParE family toxin [Rhodocyclaceae bacterium]